MYKISEELGRLVFVGGSPRSGTTLVQRVLNHHPKVYGGPEFDFIPGIAELYQRMRNSIRSGRITRIVDEPTLYDAFRELIASLLIPKAEAEGVAVLSEKTPSNVLAFDLLEEIVPESKKILVIRDPRDVINSILEVGNRQRRRLGSTSGFVRDIFAAVKYVNRCLLSGCLFAERSTNCLVVYYEDVVANPLQEANRIYTFLGIEALQQMKLSSSEFEAGKGKYFQDFCPSDDVGAEVVKNRIGASRSRLSKSDLSYIGSVIVSHPLISGKYQLRMDVNAAGTYWCMIKTITQRLAEGFWRLPQTLHRKLLSLE
jgi:Sulfotransferase family